MRLLSGREYGRTELAQRLQRSFRFSKLNSKKTGGSEEFISPQYPDKSLTSDAFSVQGLVEEVLNELEAQGWLKDSRAANLWAARRAKGHGNLAISRTLHERGFDQTCVTQALASLESTELDRAYAAWNKRFKGKSDPDKAIDSDVAGSIKQEKWVANQAHIRWKAKQQRFLMSRGFSAEVIARVLQDTMTGST